MPRGAVCYDINGNILFCAVDSFDKERAVKADHIPTLWETMKYGQYEIQGGELTMSTFGMGMVMLAVGLGLFPFGVLYFKASWKEYRNLPSNRKKVAIFLEMLDVFSLSPSLSMWFIFISLLLIIGGCALIFCT